MMCSGPSLSSNHPVTPLYPPAAKKGIIESIIADDSFLLKRCLHYEWDKVKECCFFLVDVFSKYNDSGFEYLESLVQAGKRQLTAIDQGGNNALHVACHFKPPLSVVSSILMAARHFPGAPLQLHTMVNSKNSTALAIGCAIGASTRVIQELLEPAGLENGGKAVSIADQYAITPFLGLSRRYEMFQKFPCHSKASLPLVDVTQLPAAATEGYYDNADSPLFDAFWQQVDTLIQAAWFADMHEDTSSEYSETANLRTFPLRESFLSILHGAAYVCESLPPVLTNLILRCHPEMVALNVRGILPLHLAIATDTVRIQSQVDPLLVHRRNFFIQRLLEEDPSCASSPFPGTNRSPLMEAIDSGLHWHIESVDRRSEDSIIKKKEQGPLQALWECVPSALYEADPVTGLQPFMLAASVQPTDPAEVDENDTFQLDSIYSLLRLYPQALCW